MKFSGTRGPGSREWSLSVAVVVAAGGLGEGVEAGKGGGGGRGEEEAATVHGLHACKGTSVGGEVANGFWGEAGGCG